MLIVSRLLRDQIKLHNQPAYRLAWSIGCHPATLSRLLHGAGRVRPNDPRIVAVGRLVGLRPEECFSETSDTVTYPEAQMKSDVAALRHGTAKERYGRGNR